MWYGKVLLRKKDPDKYIYHAYAVSQFGVHDRVGRFLTLEEAIFESNCYAERLNKVNVDEKKPYGKSPLKIEQGKNPWKK